MLNLFNNLFCDHNKDAWSVNNLQPIEPVFRINWPLYDECIKSRAVVGYKEIQNRQFQQMVKFKSSNPNNRTVMPE